MPAKYLRILVVEDHADTRDDLVRFLTSLGHWVESCPDAGTAMSRMIYDGLDVLLTDVWLPDARGWGYLDELSKQGKLPPRIISMSADNDGKESEQSKFHGCAAHLVMPFELKQLEAVLQ